MQALHRWRRRALPALLGDRRSNAHAQHPCRNYNHHSLTHDHPHVPCLVAFCSLARCLLRLPMRVRLAFVYLSRMRQLRAFGRMLRRRETLCSAFPALVRCARSMRRILARSASRRSPFAVTIRKSIRHDARCHRSTASLGFERPTRCGALDQCGGQASAAVVGIVDTIQDRFD